MVENEKISLLRKHIKDEGEDMFEYEELEKFLEEYGSVTDAAAEIWNIIAGNREYMEEVFGNFPSEELSDISETAVEISERFSELAEEEAEEQSKDKAQTALWDDFDKTKALDSLRR